MVKIFFRNFFRAILFSVLTVIIGGIASLIIDRLAWLVATDLFKVEYPILVSIIIGFILGFPAALLVTVFSGKWLNNDSLYVAKKPFPIAAYVIGLLLISGTVVVASAYCLITGYGAMAAALAKSNDFLVLPFIFAILPSSQIYFFVYMIKEYRCEMCEKCGRIFCIDFKNTGYVVHTKTKYKTETHKENVGAIYAGDTKIADVNANVTTGRYVKSGVGAHTYEGNCVCCGEKHYRAKLPMDT